MLLSSDWLFSPLPLSAEGACFVLLFDQLHAPPTVMGLHTIDMSSLNATGAGTQTSVHCLGNRGKMATFKKKKYLKKINVRMLKTVNDAKKESLIFVQIMLTSGYIIVLECPSYYRTHTLLIWQ